jgi:hypothetical protein
MTLHARIEAYLTFIVEDDPERFPTGLARPAAQLLLRSKALKERNWPEFAQLARDLKHENLGTIRLAIKYADVFHENVITSRREENGVYDAVHKMIREHSPKEAASSVRGAA